MDILSTVQADSTQINADDLPVPVTVTVTGVERGTPEQPVNILLAEFPDRAYRPCKSMRRVLVAAWGGDASAYIGRRITLFNDQTVQWGGKAVGGVRISAMSGIDKRITLSLSTARGKRSPFTVDPLPDKPASVAPDLVADFAKQIAEAQDTVELDLIAKNLKAQNLGEHRAALVAAWTNRRAALTAEVDA